MITITSSRESCEDYKYMTNAILRVDEDATAWDAIHAFVSIMKFEGYHEKSIFEALRDHAEDLCKNA